MLGIKRSRLTLAGLTLVGFGLVGACGVDEDRSLDRGKGGQGGTSSGGSSGDETGGGGKGGGKGGGSQGGSSGTGSSEGGEGGVDEGGTGGNVSGMGGMAGGGRGGAGMGGMAGGGRGGAGMGGMAGGGRGGAGMGGVAGGGRGGAGMGGMSGGGMAGGGRGGAGGSAGSGGPTCGNGVREGTEVCDPPFAVNECGSDCRAITEPDCLMCDEMFPECVELMDCNLGGTTEYREDCLRVLDCVRDSGCGNGLAFNCYCGTANSADCSNGMANGMCRSAIEQGLNTTNPSEIAGRFTDPVYGGGLAMLRIGCEQSVCNTECFQ